MPSEPATPDPAPAASDGWKQVYREEVYAARYAAKREGTRTSKRRHRREWSLLRRALNHASVGRGSRVLDVPTGTGRFVEPVRSLGCEVVASDIAFPMLKRARQRCREASESVAPFVQADAENLPFASDCFDLVLMVRLLHHVPTPAGRVRLLRESARVSRGYVLVSFFHTVSWHQLRDSLKHRIWPFERSRFTMTTDQLRDEAGQAGLELVRCWPDIRWVKRNWFALLAVVA